MSLDFSHEMRIIKILTRRGLKELVGLCVQSRLELTGTQLMSSIPIIISKEVFSTLQI